MPSLCRMFLRCVSTVLTLSSSAAATSPLVRFATSSLTICFSRLGDRHERLVPLLARPRCVHGVLHRLAEVPEPVVDAVDGLAQFLPAGVLQEVTAGTRLHQIVDELAVAVHAQHHYPGILKLMVLAYQARGLDAVHIRHADVHDDQSRPQLACHLYGLAAIAGLAHHPYVRVQFKYGAHTIDDQVVVIDQQISMGCMVGAVG